MSRAKPVDNSAAVSLFPFLAVLLCTMGALLVVLVAFSRSARDSAVRETAANQQVGASADAEHQGKLAKIKEFVAKVEKVRGEAQQKLREDQLRLGHLEDHIRRLHDELAKLQIAAAEMKSLENEHYNNREQAKREIERLEKLMKDAETEIAKLQEESKTRKRSFSIVPYEGPNGTYRRPIYVECVNDELILQPEGVRISRDDLTGPLGPGNPLASSLRAARDYHAKLANTTGNSRDLEPYPLLVVRPNGLIMYNRARRAIENSDFDFGFELVEQDWDLKFGVPDTQLAALEQQAIDHARMRQQALAEAAPRAYRNPGLAASGRFDYGDDTGDGYEIVDSSESGGGMPGTGEGGSGDALAEGGAGPYGGGGYGEGGPDTASGNAAITGGPNSEDARNGAPGSGGPMGQPPAGAAASSAGGSSSPPPNAVAAAGGGSSAANIHSPANAANMPQPGATGMDDPSATPQASQSVNVMTGKSSPNDKSIPPQATAQHQSHGQSFDRKKPTIPIQRSLQILVRNDHVVIFSDDASPGSTTVVGKRVPMQGDTVESLSGVVAAVNKEVQGWGLAGEGMYWKPQLVLHAGPGGQQRTNDLARLLKKNGYETSTGGIAAKPNEGGTRGATH